MSNTRTLEFDTLEVIAVSVAAYETNGGYLKSPEFGSADESTFPEVKKYPNKELVRAYFGIDHYTPRPPLIKVNEQHRAKAEDIRHYSKKAIFKVLAKKPLEADIFGTTISLSPKSSDYEECLYQLLNQDKVSAADFGYVASSPFYYENGKQRDHIKNKLNDLDSNHVGTIGSRVMLETFEVIRNTKSKNFDGHIIQGICDGNLFLYFSSKPVDHIRAGNIISIEGKVKDHVMEKDTIPMTKLTYVKERIKQ